MNDLFFKTETERVADAYRCKIVEAQRLAEAPLRPRVAQKGSDFGLFGDECAQVDLVDLARR